MQCYASTENEGLQKIKELLKLSTAELLPNGVEILGT
jgi:adenosine deaminase